MTQTQALEAAKELFTGANPDDLYVSIDRYVHASGRVRSHFYVWVDSQIVACSNRSWEHVLAIAKSGHDEIWLNDESETVLR